MDHLGKYCLSEIESYFRPLGSREHKHQVILKADWIETILGPMLAISDEASLYLLEFVSRRGLKKEIARLHMQGFSVTRGSSAPIESISAELTAYFTGDLIRFNTPYRIFGTSFQRAVWEALLRIPYGETQSYLNQAISLGRPNAFRAVANANGANQFALIIPCHRVIASDGSLGGYGGGLPLKRWLLDHEKRSKALTGSR